MGLFFPKALSVRKFEGGLKLDSDYTDLALTETNDAQNCLYGPNGDIEQRLGSEKLLNTRLLSTDGTSVRPITGHYFFRKLGASTGQHVVACGNALHDHRGTSATVILSGLNDNSNTFWNFVQIQDPRSATDDVVFGVNGVDAPTLFNGSGTAIYISSVTSATQVPIGKYILSHQRRIYIANLVDSTNADSPVKVMRSEFGADGAPNPHRFTESFIVGGSSPEGEIMGQALIRESIYYYTQNSIWRFNPGVGDTSSLDKVAENLGLLAPRSLVAVGGGHIFLSQRGIYVFDGQVPRHASAKIDEFLFNNTNSSQLKYATAIFDHKRNFYILYVAGTGSDRNNIGITLDIRNEKITWQPLITGRQVSHISNYISDSFTNQLLYGDYQGYLYKDNKTNNDGIGSNGFNETVSSATLSSVTVTTAKFTTTNDGLKGNIVRIYDGAGDGQERVIQENNSHTLTLEAAWTTTPDSTSKITIGGIDAYWRSKDISFEAEDITKLFKEINIRCKEQGKINLDVNYIINFNLLKRSTLKQVEMFKSGFVWGDSGSGVWGENRWGGTKIINKRMLLRPTSNQSLYGTHIALRFANSRANESFKIAGFDIVKKDVGRR